jgi:MFS family permease
MMALGLVYPLGAVLQGWLADVHGVRAVTAAGALVLLFLATLAALVRPTVFTNLGDPPVADTGPVPVGPAGGGTASPTATASAGEPA